VPVAFYGLAIIGIGLLSGQSLIIGLVVGIIATLISSSVINPAFLISEPLGAVLPLPSPLSTECRSLSSYPTRVSGIALSSLALPLGESAIPAAFPDQVSFILSILIVLLITAVINTGIAGLLYPRIRAFRNPGQDRQGLYLHIPDTR